MINEVAFRKIVVAIFFLALGTVLEAQNGNGDNVFVFPWSKVCVPGYEMSDFQISKDSSSYMYTGKELLTIRCSRQNDDRELHRMQNVYTLREYCCHECDHGNSFVMMSDHELKEGSIVTRTLTVQLIPMLLPAGGDYYLLRYSHSEVTAEGWNTVALTKGTPEFDYKATVGWYKSLWSITFTKSY